VGSNGETYEENRNKIETVELVVVGTQINGLANYIEKIHPSNLYQDQRKIPWNLALINLLQVLKYLQIISNPNESILIDNLRWLSNNTYLKIAFKTMKTKLQEAIIEVLTANKKHTDLSIFFQTIVYSFVDDILRSNAPMHCYIQSDNADKTAYNTIRKCLIELTEAALPRILYYFKYNNLPLSNLINSQLSNRLTNPSDGLNVAGSIEINGDQTQEAPLKSVAQLQEVTELFFSALNTIPNIHAAYTSFKNLARTVLTDNPFLTSYNQNQLESDIINWPKLGLIYNQLQSELIDNSESHNIEFSRNDESLVLALNAQILEKLLAIEVTDEQQSQLQGVEYINPHRYLVATDSKDITNLSLNKFEVAVICKLIILKYIANAHKTNSPNINLPQIIRIMQDFGLKKEEVMLHYAMCTKPETITPVGHKTVEARPPLEINPERDIAIHDLSKNPEAVAKYLIEFFLPDEFRRLVIPYDYNTTEENYQKSLREAGFIKALEIALNKIGIEEEIEIEVVFYDGSAYFQSSDPAQVGVNKKLPTVKIVLNLGGKECEVTFGGVSFDHHPLVPGIKMDLPCATAEILEYVKEKLVEPITDTKIPRIIVSVAESSQALDTDLSGANILLKLAMKDPDWFKRNLKFIEIISTLIDLIDRAAGAPILPNPNSIADYLCLQLLYLPLSTLITVDRKLANSKELKEILQIDTNVFIAFVEFIAMKYPDIKTLEDLMNSIYGIKIAGIREDYYAEINGQISRKFILELYSYYIERFQYPDNTNKNHSSSTNSAITQKTVVEIFKAYAFAHDNFAESMKNHIIYIPIKISPNKTVKLAVIKHVYYVETEGINRSLENIGTIAYLRSVNADIYLQSKSEANQNYTSGLLDPESGSIRKLFNGFLAECWSYFLFRPDVRPFIQGDDTIGGTRTYQSGTKEFDDNIELAKIFGKTLEQLLVSGLKLDRITPKLIFLNSLFTLEGNINMTNYDIYEQTILTNYKRNSQTNYRQRLDSLLAPQTAASSQ